MSLKEFEILQSEGQGGQDLARNRFVVTHRLGELTAWTVRDVRFAPAEVDEFTLVDEFTAIGRYGRVRELFAGITEASKMIEFSVFGEASAKAKTEAEADTVEQRFVELRDEWIADTLVESNYTTIVTHRAYQRIIGLGMPALPYILADLAKTARPWLWALSAITGEDIAEDAADSEEARDRWLAWGRSRGLLD